MGWAVWLSVPIGVTLLAAVVTWLVGRHRRPRPPEGTDESMAAHRDYLDALVLPARGQDRVAPPDLDGPGAPFPVAPPGTRLGAAALSGARAVPAGADDGVLDLTRQEAGASGAGAEQGPGEGHSSDG